MIRYQLQCKAEHQFDGWFSNSTAYDEQAREGHISCPICGSSDIGKAIMAPNIPARSNKKENGTTPDDGAPASETDNTDVGENTGSPPAAIPAPSAADQSSEIFAMQREFVEVMRTVRKKMVESAEFVGPRFAEEARKIHYEETEPRGIYGEASEEDVTELTEEGIEFMPLPRLPEDNN